MPSLRRSSSEERKEGKRSRMNGANPYAEFALQFSEGGCWYCGWIPGQFDTNFFHVKLDIAHVIGGNGRRKKDRRALVYLCSFPCHQLNHGATIRYHGEPLPKITLANMLWLKQRYDPEYYDPEWIASLWHGRALPEPEEPVRPRWKK